MSNIYTNILRLVSELDWKNIQTIEDMKSLMSEKDIYFDENQYYMEVHFDTSPSVETKYGNAFLDSGRDWVIRLCSKELSYYDIDWQRDLDFVSELNLKSFCKRVYKQLDEPCLYFENGDYVDIDQSYVDIAQKIIIIEIDGGIMGDVYPPKVSKPELVE